jgi:hypothetical protein
MDNKKFKQISKQNAAAVKFLTENLSAANGASDQVYDLIDTLGNAVDQYPEWHPILVNPNDCSTGYASVLSQIDAYEGIDHTVCFVRGFITCPYSKNAAYSLIDSVNLVKGLKAYRLEQPLYSDNAYPVVVEATEVKLDADGTILTRDALVWSMQQALEEVKGAERGETWWNLKTSLLGSPSSSCSSSFVSEYTGIHMKKIIEAMNYSGMYGPIKEESLEMFSADERKSISETLVIAAYNAWSGLEGHFNFMFRGEYCHAEIRELDESIDDFSISVRIANSALKAAGRYYQDTETWVVGEPTGQRKLAEKFLAN